MRRTFVVCLAILALIAAAGCGDSGRRTGLAVPTGARLAGDYSGSGPGTLISANMISGLQMELVDASSLAARITYTSTSGIDNSTTQVSGAVFVPHGKPPLGGWPTVGLGHSTAGVKPECAPSLSRNFLNLATTIVGLLKAGFMVAVPDYQGLGSEGSYHPYLDSTTVGYNLIDSVRAARKLVHAMSNRWVALGADQGGQAAWAASELADRYDDSLHLLGAISLAPFTDLGALADAAAAGALTREQKLQLPVFLAALKNEHSDTDLDAYRRGSVRDKWDVLLACKGSEVQARDQVADQIGADDLRPANPAATDALRGYLQKSSLAQWRAAAPMWVIYGGRDPFTPQEWTARTLERACGYGDAIRIEKQPNIRPDSIDLGRAIPWIKERLDGKAPTDDCLAFIGKRPPTVRGE
jgi:pimeloyl-ACP methyl ester carboxylesterase